MSKKQSTEWWWEDITKWWEDTLNLGVGCSKVSTGCKKCFAEGYCKRFWKAWGLLEHAPFMPTPWPQNFAKITKLKKGHDVAVNLMTDTFHGKYPARYIVQTLSTLAHKQGNRFFILTKRPETMAEVIKLTRRIMIEEGYKKEALMSNIYFGVSVENSACLYRADILKAIPGIKRFISHEPLLGPIVNYDYTGIHWVIVGGEKTNSKPRQMVPLWLYSIVEECNKAKVPFFFKHWGDYYKMGSGPAKMEFITNRKEKP